MIRPAHPPSADQVARHYDELDRYYRDFWGEQLHHGLWIRGDETPEEAVQALTDRIARCADVGPGDRVCDVGCGYGAVARSLAADPGARVTGLTLSRRQYRHAKGLEDASGGSLRFLLRDWLHSGLPAGSFEAVIAVECVSHVEDKAAFFREAVRTLRPGGRLVVAAWLASDEASSWEKRFMLEPICAEGRLPGLASAREHVSWIGEAGFRQISFQDLSRQVRRTWSVCLRRVAARFLSDPGIWAYMRDPASSERRFGLSLARIWTAYRTGALRYGLFTAVAEDGGHQPPDASST